MDITFKKTKVKKSHGPDGMTGRLLRNWTEQLSQVFYDIFSMSLEQRKVPRLWKESIVVPLAKCTASKQLNDLRPVATSWVMKSFEKLVKAELLNLVQDSLGPKQFAYRAGGVEDACITAYCQSVLLLHQLSSGMCSLTSAVHPVHWQL